MQYSQGNTCVKVSKKETSTKVFSCGYCTISKKKETLAPVFSCEICKIFEISSFKEHFRATASILIACNTNYLVFFSFFWLIWSLFIDFLVHLAYWFCPTYWVIMMIQIHFDSYTFGHWSLIATLFSFLNQWAEVRGRNTGKFQWMFYQWF